MTDPDAYRISATAAKINDAFDAARIEARDEALWLAEKCRELQRDNQWLRQHIETLEKQLGAAKKEQP